MEVSIAFPHNGANTDIIYNIRNGRKNLISENYVSFRYAGKDSQRQQEINLMYFCCVKNTTLRGTTPIISENYEQAVFPIFNDKAIGKTPVNWIHDEACSDKAGIKENYILTTMKKANPAGSTTGYIFTIPVAEKDLAEKTLEKLVASTSEYLDVHPEQQYTLIHRLSGNRGNANAPSSIMNSGMQSEVQYDVLYGSDDDGYHFLFLKTDGSLWIPKQYSLLKNIKNYKKSYLKGKAKKK